VGLTACCAAAAAPEFWARATRDCRLGRPLPPRVKHDRYCTPCFDSFVQRSEKRRCCNTMCTAVRPDCVRFRVHGAAISAAPYRFDWALRSQLRLGRRPPLGHRGTAECAACRSRRRAIVRSASVACAEIDPGIVGRAWHAWRTCSRKRRSQTCQVRSTSIQTGVGVYRFPLIRYWKIALSPPVSHGFGRNAHDGRTSGCGRRCSADI
jgi:hypothetical protein